MLIWPRALVLISFWCSFFPSAYATSFCVSDDRSVYEVEESTEVIRLVDNDPWDGGGGFGDSPIHYTFG